MLLLPEYNILERISSKSSNLLYRAERESDKQKVILRIFEEANSVQKPDRIIDEFEIASRFSYKGIAQYLKLETYNNQVIAVLENVEGISLEQYLQDHELSISDALTIATAIANILQFFYQQGLVLHDLCPAHLLVDPDTLDVYLVDFSFTSQASEQNQPIPFPLLLKGGALRYISPEQTGRVSGEIDIRSSLYTLGIIIYEMVTGSVPFPATEPLSIIHCHIAKNPMPPQASRPDIPLVFSEIILKLLSKNAADRYQSPYGLTIDLAKCLTLLERHSEIDWFNLGQSDFSGRLQNLKQFYGREEELASLDFVFRRIRNGEVEVMLVEGYSGIGKSALVHQFKNTVTRQGGIFVEGKFNQFQRDIPYFGFIQALKEFIDFILMQSNEEIALWKENISNAVGVNARLLTDIIPHLETLIGPGEPVVELGPKENQNRFHYVFISFIKCICQKDHPFVIFLDDLQWADSASMNLFKIICANKDIKYLLFIGAYRDNEITTNSIFADTAENMEKEGFFLQRIPLSPLSYKNVQIIIFEILNASVHDGQSLVTLIYQKSQGNPFFITAFLKCLYAEGILVFDFNILQWVWDESKISHLKFGENIVELMTGRIRKLPHATQGMLQLAAFLGYYFDTQLMSIVSQQTKEEIEEKLKYALSEDLILRVGDSYCFSHDRIQQAAYSLLPEDRSKQQHLSIGKALVENLTSELRDDYIFEIVNQLNAGAETISITEDRNQLAEFNLTAGMKAKGSAAYIASFGYLQMGIRLLHAGIWRNNYSLALKLYSEGAESAFLSGNSDIMEQWIDTVILNASTVLDKVKVYEIRIRFYIAQYKQFEAVQTALQILELLNVRFPKTPSKLHVLVAMMKVRLALLRRGEETLMELSLVRDRVVEAAISILISVGSAVIFSPNLFVLMSSRTFLLMINNGNTAYSGYIYSGYGVVLLKGFGNIKFAAERSNLALQLSEKFDINSSKCSARFLVQAFFSHWKEHIKNTLEPLLNNYWYGLENGNTEFASYSALHYCQNAFFCGRNLKTITEENSKFYERFPSLRNEYAYNMHSVTYQAALNLFELTNQPTILSGKVHDEEKMIGIYSQTARKRELFKLYLYKILLSYLFEKYDEAHHNAGEAERLMKSSFGNPEIIIFYFYHTLATLAQVPRNSRLSKKRLLTKANANIKTFRRFAEIGPMNCLHKLLLMEAELCRVTDQPERAAVFYDAAIAKATENDYPNDLALANELAGKFYQFRNQDDISQAYMVQAYNIYQQWGAFNKLRQLEQKYSYIPQYHQPKKNVGNDSLISNTTSFSRQSFNEENISKELDLQTIMKAAAAISSEVQLDKLLKKLVRIAVENSGAHQGYLILNNHSDFSIEAKSSIDEAEEDVLQSIPLTGNELISEAIVRFVAATKENIVLDNAVDHPHFSVDPVISKKRSKSILCTSILHQAEVIGLLYFENDLMTDAFTQDRIELLKLLSGQMAISLQNAINEQKKMNDLLEREKLIQQINLHEQELLKTKLEIQEQTFHNISGELHDNIGQTLSFIKLNINTVNVEDSDLAKEKLAESRNLLTKVIQDIRDLAKTLNSDHIEKIGLTKAIDQQLQFLKKTGLYSAQLTVNGEISKYDFQRELVIFRIVQELLNNIVKHAEATSVHISMDYQINKLLLTVEDNGKGFDIEKQLSPDYQALGLRNIHNRISLVKGNIFFKSELQKGTMVTIELDK